jgi:hypothetical protein
LPLNVSCRLTIGPLGGTGRTSHAPSPRIRTPATTAATRVIRRANPAVFRRAGRSSAAAKSAVDGNRSAGDLASARVTAASRPAGTSRNVPRWGRGSLSRLAMIACAVGPMYGGSPASISYSTHARLYWSVRPSTRDSAIACSGLMYAGVPSESPVSVSLPPPA